MTPELALQQNPWIVHVATAGMAMLGYMFDQGEVERQVWPENNPVIETEIISYRIRAPRVRQRVVGRQWIGWDATTPASPTIGVDEEGASVFGVRCTMRAEGASREPQEVEA